MGFLKRDDDGRSGEERRHRSRRQATRARRSPRLEGPQADVYRAGSMAGLPSPGASGSSG